VSVMSGRGDAADVLFGVVVAGVRVGAASARVARAPVALAARTPVIGTALRGTAAQLAAEGGRARRVAWQRLDRTVAGVDLDAALTALLEHPQTRELVDALATNPAFERLVADALDSRLTVELTDRVLQGPVMQHTIEHLANSPELRQVVAEQSAGMAEQAMDGVRRRSVVLDDAAERTVRGWLRRPRPQVS
jgi:hypothetical protein